MAFKTINELLAATSNPLLASTPLQRAHEKAATGQIPELTSGSGPSDGFMQSLTGTESGGRWDAQNNEVGAGGAAGHFGRLQFGKARLDDFARAHGIGSIDPEQFKRDPNLQQMVERWHFADIDKYIGSAGLDKYIGQSVKGTQITKDAMYAMAHLGGKGGLKKYLETGGRHDPSDAYGTSLSDYASKHGSASGGDTRVASADSAVPADQQSAVMSALENYAAALPDTSRLFDNTEPEVEAEDDSWARDFFNVASRVTGDLFGFDATVEEVTGVSTMPAGQAVTAILEAAFGADEEDFRRQIQKTLGSFDEHPDTDVTPDALWAAAEEGRIDDLLLGFTELAFVNSPYLIGMMMGAPGFVATGASIAESLAQERAANDGREGKPNATDLFIGVVAAIPTMLAERFSAGAMGLAGGALGRVGAAGASAAGAVTARPLGRVAAAGVIETGQEAVEEGLQYYATHTGTEKGADHFDALKTAFAGGGAGAVGGVTVRGGVELMGQPARDQVAALSSGDEISGSGRDTAAEAIPAPPGYLGEAVPEGAAPSIETMDESQLAGLDRNTMRDRRNAKARAAEDQRIVSGLGSLEPNVMEEDLSGVDRDEIVEARTTTPSGEQQPLFGQNEDRDDPAPSELDRLRAEQRMLRRATPKQLKAILQRAGASTDGTRKELLTRAREVIASDLQTAADVDDSVNQMSLFDPPPALPAKQDEAAAEEDSASAALRNATDFTAWARFRVETLPRDDPKTPAVQEALRRIEGDPTADEALKELILPLQQAANARSEMERQRRDFRKDFVKNAMRRKVPMPKTPEERRSYLTQIFAFIADDTHAGLSDGRVSAVEPLARGKDGSFNEPAHWRRDMLDAAGTAATALKTVELYWSERARERLAEYAEERAAKASEYRSKKLSGKARRDGTTARDDYDAEQAQLVKDLFTVGNALIDAEEASVIRTAQKVSRFAEALGADNIREAAAQWPAAYADLGAFDPELAKALHAAITGDNPLVAAAEAKERAFSFVESMQRQYQAQEEPDPVSPRLAALRKGSSAWTALKEELEGSFARMPHRPSDNELASEYAEQRALLEDIDRSLATYFLEDLARRAPKSVGDKLTVGHGAFWANTGIPGQQEETALGQFLSELDKYHYGAVIRRLYEIAETFDTEAELAEAGEAGQIENPIPFLVELLEKDERPLAKTIKDKIHKRFGPNAKAPGTLTKVWEPQTLRAIADELTEFGYYKNVIELAKLENTPEAVEYAKKLIETDPFAASVARAIVGEGEVEGEIDTPISQDLLRKLYRVKHTLSARTIDQLTKTEKGLTPALLRQMQLSVDPLPPALRWIVELSRAHNPGAADASMLGGKDASPAAATIAKALTYRTVADALEARGDVNTGELALMGELRFEERVSRWDAARRAKSRRAAEKRADTAIESETVAEAAAATEEILARKEVAVAGAPRITAETAPGAFKGRVTTFAEAIEGDPKFGEVASGLQPRLKELAATLDKSIDWKYVAGKTSTPLPKSSVLVPAKRMIKRLHKKLPEAAQDKLAENLADALLRVAHRANAARRITNAIARRSAKPKAAVSSDDYFEQLAEWEVEQDRRAAILAKNPGADLPPGPPKPRRARGRGIVDDLRKASVRQKWDAEGSQALTSVEVEDRAGKPMKVDRQKYAPEYGDASSRMNWPLDALGTKRRYRIEEARRAKADTIERKPREAHYEWWRSVARKFFREAFAEMSPEVRAGAAVVFGPRAIGLPRPSASMSYAELQALARKYNERMAELGITELYADRLARLKEKDPAPAPTELAPIKLNSTRAVLLARMKAFAAEPHPRLVERHRLLLRDPPPAPENATAYEQERYNIERRDFHYEMEELRNQQLAIDPHTERMGADIVDLLVSARSASNVREILTQLRKLGAPSTLMNGLLDTALSVAGAQKAFKTRTYTSRKTGKLARSKVASRDTRTKQAKLAAMTTLQNRSALDAAVERTFNKGALTRAELTAAIERAHKERRAEEGTTKRKTQTVEQVLNELAPEPAADTVSLDEVAEREENDARARPKTRGSVDTREDDAFMFAPKTSMTRADSRLQAVLSERGGQDVSTVAILDFAEDNAPRALRPLVRRLKRLNLRTRVSVRPAADMPPDALGYYDPNTDTVILREDAGMWVLLHEYVHAASLNVVRSNPVVAARVRRLMDRVLEVRSDLRDSYALSSPEEFVAEAHANLSFQRLLKSLSMVDRPQTFWTAVLDAVRYALNVPVPRSVMNEIMSLDNELMRPGGSRRRLSPAVARVVETGGGAALTSVARQTYTNMRSTPFEWWGRGTKAEFHAQSLMQMARRYESRFMSSGRSLLREYTESLARKWQKVHRHLTNGRELLGRYSSYVENNPELGERLADVMTYATLEGVDPSKSEADQPKRNFNKVALTKATASFNKLDANGQKVFTDMRDHFAAEWHRLLNAVVSNRVIMRGLGADMDPTILRRMVSMMLAEPDVAKREAIKDAVVEKLKKLPNPDARIELVTATAEVAAQMVDHYHFKGLYFPIHRFGDYVLEWKGTFSMTGVSGSTIDRMLAEEPALIMSHRKRVGASTYDVDFTLRLFDMRESSAAAARAQKTGAELWKTMTARYPGIVTTRSGEVDKRREHRLGAGDSAGRLFDQLKARKDRGEVTEKEFEHLREALFSLMPATSVNSSMMKRDNVALMHHNMQRGFAAHMQSSAFWLAQMEEGRDAARALAALDNHIDEQLRAGKSTVFERALVNYMRNRDEAESNFTPPNLAQRITLNAATANYLFSVSYSMINALQTKIVTVPYLQSKFGIPATLREMARADEVLFGNMLGNSLRTGLGFRMLGKRQHARSDIFDSIADNAIARIDSAFSADPKLAGALPELKAIIQYAEDLGMVEFTHAMDVRMAAQGTQEGTVGAYLQSLMDAGRAVPQSVEVYNRLSTLLATYMLMKTDGKKRSLLDLQRGVVDAMEQTQVAYMAWNAPAFLSDKGPLGRLAPYLGLFMKFGQAMVSLQIDAFNQWRSDVKAATTIPEKAKAALLGEGARLMTGLLATHSLAAGISGGLLLQPIRIAIQAIALIAGDDDDPDEFWDDPDTYVMNSLSSIYGPDTAEVLTYGVPRALGADISSRVNLAHLIGGFWTSGRTPMETVENFVFAMLGPVGGMVGQSVRAMESDSWAKTIATAPNIKLVRDIAGAYELSERGLTKPSGAPIAVPEQFDNLDLLWKAAGFTPAEVASVYEKRTAVLGIERRSKDRASALKDHYAKATTAAERVASRLQIRAFNAANPRLRISGDDLSQRRKDFRKQKKAATRGRVMDSDLDYKRFERDLNF